MINEILFDSLDFIFDSYQYNDFGNIYYINFDNDFYAYMRKLGPARKTMVIGNV